MPTTSDLERALQPPDSTWFPPPDLDQIRREGNQWRRRGRRRAATGIGLVAAASTAVAVMLAPYAISNWTRNSTAAERPATEPRTDAELLQTCRDGNVPNRAVTLLFGDSSPAVKSVVRNDYQVRLAIESADGKYWGDCFVSLQRQEFTAGMMVYPTEGSQTGLALGSGPGCGLSDGAVEATCPTFWAEWVDRRPLEVSVAEVTTADGHVTKVLSHDGYLVFNYVGKLPRGIRNSPEGLPADFAPIVQMTFLDSNGNAIAAQAFAGGAGGLRSEKVGQLPLLNAYPSQYGDWIH